MKTPRGNREVSRPPRGFLLLNVFASMPSCTLPSLAGKVARKACRMSPNNEIFIYTLIVQSCVHNLYRHFVPLSPIGKAFFQVSAYALTVSSSVTGFGLTFATTLLICFVENNNAAMATSIARSTSTTELAVKLYKSGFLLPA